MTSFLIVSFVALSLIAMTQGEQSVGESGSLAIPNVKWTQRRNKLLLTVVENNIENGKKKS
jgi:hypothetical protein